MANGTLFLSLTNIFLSNSLLKRKTQLYYSNRWFAIKAAYAKRVSAGSLKTDDYQLKVIDKLLLLDHELTTYQPILSPLKFFSKIRKIYLKESINDRQPRGIYLHGTVGCGKTMLMDLFYEQTIVKKSKRRIHYHAFMADIHRRIHAIKTDPLYANVKDPIPMVADLIISESWLLCLDEFQVTDVADAMILKHLFSELFDKGIVLVATSNRPPEDLYKNGLQRAAFLPFICILKSYCSVVCLDSGVDYRRVAHTLAGETYFVIPNGDGTTINTSGFIKPKAIASDINNRSDFQKTGSLLDSVHDKEYSKSILTNAQRIDDVLGGVDALFKRLAARENDSPRPRTFNVLGRDLTVWRACGGVADLDFDDWCARPTGATDYLVLSQIFHTVVMRNVRQLDPTKNPQETHRFITLIDTFYDNHVRLIIVAYVPLQNLFVTKEQKKPNNMEQLMTDANRLLMDDLKIDAAKDGANLSVFTSDEEIFAMVRAISRLNEMQSAEYWKFREPSNK